MTAPTTPESKRAELRQAALDGDLDLLRAASRLYEAPDDTQPPP